MRIVNKNMFLRRATNHGNTWKSSSGTRGHPSYRTAISARLGTTDEQLVTELNKLVSLLPTRVRSILDDHPEKPKVSR